jgi:hypothetical protein
MQASSGRSLQISESMPSRASASVRARCVSIAVDKEFMPGYPNGEFL